MNQTPVTATDEGIQVVGARENNLKDVSLVIPKNRITVFVGVSGSGKSSLVFDTVAVEAQRQLNATFPWNIRHDLPKFERPHVDAVTRLTTPVVVDQRPLGGNARSTVGTVTDVYTVMRVLFANHGNDGLGQTWLYSFNDPKGMCPECEGLGRTRRPSPELMIDRGKSIAEGAILLPGYTIGSANWQFYHTQRMHLRYGPELGAAVRRLMPGTEVDDPIRKRFVRAATATTPTMLAQRLRDIITLLRREAIALDYGLLADQLHQWQRPGGAEQVRRSWGRSFHAHRNPKDTSNTADAPAGANATHDPTTNQKDDTQ